MPSPRRPRRLALLLSAFAAAALAGMAIVRVPPLFAIGLAAALLFVTAVMLRPFWGLLIYTCIFFLRPGELYPVLAPLHLERVVGVITLVSMFVEQHRRSRRLYLDGSSQTALLFAFMAVALLSVPFSYWRSQALDGLVQLAKILVFYLLTVHLLTNRLRLRLFIWTLSLLVAYMAGDSFASYLRGSFRFAQGIERAIGQTSAAGDPNSLGTTLAATMPLFVMLALYKPLRWWRCFFALAAGLLMATIAVTGSRASALGFLGGLGYLWWSSRRRLVLGVIGALLLCGVFLLLPDQYQTRYSTITRDELDASSRARLSAWTAGFRMVADRPLVGVGIGCFGTAHALGYSPEGRRTWLQPHSIYVQVPAELGLVGAVVFFSFLLAFLRTNRKTTKMLRQCGNRWRFEEVILNGVFAGCVVLLISGVFGHSLLRRTWYIYAAIGLSILRMYDGHAALAPIAVTASPEPAESEHRSQQGSSHLNPKPGDARDAHPCDPC